MITCPHCGADLLGVKVAERVTVWVDRELEIHEPGWMANTREAYDYDGSVSVSWESEEVHERVFSCPDCTGKIEGFIYEAFMFYPPDEMAMEALL